jgi:hypothetical protein
MVGGNFDDKAAALNPCTWRYGYFDGNSCYTRRCAQIPSESRGVHVDELLDAFEVSNASNYEGSQSNRATGGMSTQWTRLRRGHPGAANRLQSTGFSREHPNHQITNQYPTHP